MKTVLSELFLFSSIPWFYILLVFRSFGLGVARAVWVHRHPPVTGSLLVSSHSPRFQPWEKQALRGWENVIWKAWWVEDDSDALGLGADKTQHDTPSSEWMCGCFYCCFDCYWLYIYFVFNDCICFIIQSLINHMIQILLFYPTLPMRKLDNEKLGTFTELHS